MAKNNTKKFIIILLIIGILILGTYFYLNLADYFLLIEKKEIDTRVLVSDKIGFDINASALTFGSILPGKSSSSREIALNNNYNRSVKVEIYITGKIGDFMQISENNFILEKDEEKRVSFVVSFPGKAEKGEYNGKIYVLIKKVF